MQNLIQGLIYAWAKPWVPWPFPSGPQRAGVDSPVLSAWCQVVETPQALALHGLSLEDV